MFDDNQEVEDLKKEVAALKEKLSLIGRVDQYKASLIHTYHFAGNELLKCNSDRFMGSGLIVEIKKLSGEHMVMPFMVKDGLSNQTINSLLDDMQRSFDNSIQFKPVEKRLK